MRIKRKEIIIGLIIILLVTFISLYYFFKNGTVEKELIQINNIKSGQIIKSPLVIKGAVNGGRWAAFEGQVGRVELIRLGESLGMAPLTITSDFMKFPTSFETTLNFDNSKEGNATLVFHNENASGLPEGDETIVIPVKILK